MNLDTDTVVIVVGESFIFPPYNLVVIGYYIPQLKVIKSLEEM